MTNLDDKCLDYQNGMLNPPPAPPIDDASELYKAARKNANAPSSNAWKLAQEAGVDPSDVVLDKPVFDRIEKRHDGNMEYMVGVDEDNPENL